MLIILSGLPGTGKTTISRALLEHRSAVFLRIDSIEQALRSSDTLAGDVGPAGYMVGYALARANLQMGQTVIADSVNPLVETRQAWRSVAASCASAWLELEVICSDQAEHRRRVETRSADLPGHRLPTWQAVTSHYYQPWTTPRTVIDTATTSAEDAAQWIWRLVEQQLAEPM